MCSCRGLDLCVTFSKTVWFWMHWFLISPSFDESTLVHPFNEPDLVVISLGYLLTIHSPFTSLAHSPLLSISLSHAVFTLWPVGGADLATLPAQQETESRAREMGRAQRSWWMSSFYPIVSAFLDRCTWAFSGVTKTAQATNSAFLRVFKSLDIILVWKGFVRWTVQACTAAIYTKFRCNKTAMVPLLLNMMGKQWQRNMKQYWKYWVLLLYYCIVFHNLKANPMLLT